MAAKIRTIQNLGFELSFRQGDHAIPDGITLPSYLIMQTVWYKQRGVIVGRRWYLQCHEFTHGQQPIEIVNVDGLDGEPLLNNNGCLELEAWMKANGYEVWDESCFIWKRA